MSEITDVESSQGQAQGNSSDSNDDLRGALQSAMREVSERARDEAGRFAKNEEKIEANPAPSPTPAPSQEGQQASAPAPAPAPIPAAEQQAAAPSPAPAIKPPDSWTPAAKAKFATLDPEIQAEVMRREKEVHQGFTKFDEHRNIGKSFTEAVAPYLPMIRAEGGEPLQAVQMLLQTAHNLRTAGPEQKQQMLINLAQQYQIDMQGVFNRLTGKQQNQVPPQVQQLQQQIADLQRQIQESTQTRATTEQAQYQTEIERFASDPANLYFENVRPAMAALIRDGVAKDLKEAYDMACWARPDIRPLLLQQTEQQKQEAAKAKAQQARAAAVSVSGAPAGSAGNVPPQDRSLADEIRANMREIMGRT